MDRSSPSHEISLGQDARRSPSTGTWWEVRHPAFPNGTGWVEGTAFLPDSDIGPLARSILLLEATEGFLPRVRYRIRYRVVLLPPPPADRSVPTSILQVDRFNLGPALRKRRAADIGSAHTESPENFGVGPHVSYRFTMLPTTGQIADLIGVARAQIPEAFAEGMSCIGLPCLSLEPIAEKTVAWQGEAEIVIDFKSVYERFRNGMLSPVAAIDFATHELNAATVSGERLVWTGFEPRNSPTFLEPFIEAIIDVNLGPDGAVEAVVENRHFRDHMIETVWQRISTTADGTPAPPILGAQTVESRLGPD